MKHDSFLFNYSLAVIISIDVIPPLDDVLTKYWRSWGPFELEISARIVPVFVKPELRPEVESVAFEEGREGLENWLWCFRHV